MRKEHDFGRYKSPEEWEQSVFDSASHFSTIDLVANERGDFDSFKAAYEYAVGRPRCLIYAVTESGRQAVVPRELWELLAGVKKEVPKSKPGTCKICNKAGGKVAQIQGRWVHASCWRTERL